MLPNHYHALVGAADILGLLHELGRFHGRTSHAGNGEENARGHVGIDEAQPGGLEMGVVEGGLARGARAADEAGVGDALGGDGVGEGLWVTCSCPTTSLKRCGRYFPGMTG